MRKLSFVALAVCELFKAMLPALRECAASAYFAPRPKRITLKVARMMAKSSLRERFLI